MAFKEDLSEGFELLGNTINDVAEILAEKNKIRAQCSRIKQIIKADTSSRDKAYIELGKYYYQNLREGAPADNEGYCATIDKMNARIEKASLKFVELQDLQNETKIQSENAEKLKEVIQIKAEQLKEDASEKAREASEKAKVKAGEAWDKTKEKAGEAWDKTKVYAEDAWDKTKTFATDQYTKIKEKSADKIDDIEEELEDKVEEAEEYVEDTKEVAEEAKEGIKEKVESVIEDLKDKVTVKEEDFDKILDEPIEKKEESPENFEF